MAITPADIETLVKIIKATESNQGNTMLYEYTITGAKDWPMLISIGGGAAVVLCSVVFVLVGVIWKTLPKKEDLDDIARRFGADIEKLAERWEVSIEKMSIRHNAELEARNAELEARVEKVWSAFTDCQRECCPRRKFDEDNTR